MDKVIKGTKDNKQYRVIKGTQDQRELRCPKCKNVATQVPNGKGGLVCRCPICQTEFKFTKL